MPNPGVELLPGLGRELEMPEADGKHKHEVRKEQKGKNTKINVASDIIQGIIAIAAVGALIYSARTFDSNRITSERQLRAWLIISSVSLANPLGPGLPAQVNFVAKNTGQTPALNVRSRIIGERSGEDFGPHGGRCDPATRLLNPYKSALTVGPGETISNPSLGIFSLSQGCFEDLHRGVAEFIVRGSLTYADIFGSQHVTNFCYQYEGATSRTITACQGNNDLN